MYQYAPAMTREEYLEATKVSRVASMRGQLKAKQRHTKLIKRDIQIRNRLEEQYQVRLGTYYLQNF